MFQIISRLVSTLAGFLYPSYASYKAIQSKDLPKLEVWLMYWTVMGCIMAMESTVEWIFAWFPFYYECKTLVILWLTLPQIQGSTYIYVAHVQPFLAAHESDIDAAVANAKVRAKAAGVEWLNTAVQRIRQAVVGTLAFQELPNDPLPPAQTMRHPPTLADPASGATSQLYNIAGNVLRTYGPAAVAAGSALLHPMNGREPPSSRPQTGSAARNDAMRGLGVANGDRPRTTSFPSSYGGTERQRVESFASGRAVSMTKAQARQRRAELEAQLAEIESVASHSSDQDSSYSGSSSSSPYHPRSVSAGQRASSFTPRDPVAARIDRSFVGGYGFEEIGKDELGDYPPIHAAAMAPGPSSPGGTKRASWWWWSQQGGQGGYISVGSEDKKDA